MATKQRFSVKNIKFMVQNYWIDINTKDYAGYTPLDLALSDEQWEIALFLKRIGAKNYRVTCPFAW